MTTIVKLVVLLSFGCLSFVSAGQRAIIKGGSREVIPLKRGDSAVKAIEEYKKGTRSVGYLDSEVRRIRNIRQNPEQHLINGEDYELRWDDRGSLVNFGFDTGDSMAQWFEPVAGSILKSVLLYVVNFEGKAEFFVHSAQYAGEVATLSCTDADGWVGLYLDADGEPCDRDEGDECTWSAGDNECFSSPPVGSELWPHGLGGWGYVITSDDANSYITVDLGVLGYPDMGREPFFVLAEITRTSGCGFAAWNNSMTPYHSFKYYHTGENSPTGNPGWHLRSYGFEMYAIVEYYEDIPPFITEVTRLTTTFSTGPREVTAKIWDDNPGGGEAGIDGVWLNWETDLTSDSLGMTFESDSIYSGSIPGMSPGTQVTYWIEAVDINGNRSPTRKFSYSIFGFLSDCLIILNPGNYWLLNYYCYPWPPYEPHEPLCDCLSWESQMEFPEVYTTIIEITGEGSDCIDGYAEWLDSGGKNYMITGDEWLGPCFFGSDNPVDILPGEFAHDYLGLDYYYPNINVRQPGDEYGVSRLIPVSGDPISGELHSFLADSLLLNYDPNFELGEENWMDGVETVEGASISYYGVTGILDSSLVPTGRDTVPSAVYHKLPNGSKTAFFGFDILGLNTMREGSESLHGLGYHWVGIYPEGPVLQTLIWMGAYPTATDDRESPIPQDFHLAQPYPNPFNPATTLQYDLPRAGYVSLIIYDLLGREVEVTVSKWQEAGTHSVVWDATDIPTGIYFVRMVSGEFSQVRKVMVLK